MSNANSKQAEQLKLIGEQLRQTREQQGVALDQVALKTFIPLRLLQAIEDGEMARLPEPIFVQGFIRRYGDLLGLDGVELSKQFPVDTSPATPVTESKSGQPMPIETVGPTPFSHSSSKIPVDTSKPRGKAASQLWPWAIAGGAALLILGTAIASLRRPQPGPSVNSTAPAPVTVPELSPSPLTAVSPPVAGSPSATPSPLASSDGRPTTSPTPSTRGPVQVSLNATDRAWVEVVADGKTVFSGTLSQGEQKAWTAQKSLTVFSGNAGAVQLSHNNGPAKSMGKVGQVQEARFTATTP